MFGAFFFCISLLRDLALLDVLGCLHVFTAEEVRSKLDEVHGIGENQAVCRCDGGCVPAGVAIINRLRLLPFVHIFCQLSFSCVSSHSSLTVSLSVHHFCVHILSQSCCVFLCQKFFITYDTILQKHL